ncbi:MAG: flagellar basal-body rod protein FlgG [Methylococcaceae bacterium]
MIRSLWIARSGLEAQQINMDVITNNLANVSTNGFKKSRAIFEDTLYQTIRQPGAQSSLQNTQLPSGLQLGTGVRPVATERLFLQGSLELTGNDKDLAIQGTGFFQVMMPDGNIGYTRDGSFQTDSQGRLVTASGFIVIPEIIVPFDATSFSVSRDGIVSITQQGNVNPVQIGNIELASFINPPGLEAKGQNLYVETAASGAPYLNKPDNNGFGYLAQQSVETSNVSVVEEMTNMITAQRAYEINGKAVTTCDEMLQKLTQL